MARKTRKSKKAKALEKRLQASKAQLHEAKQTDADKKKKKAELLRAQADEAQAALEKLLGITHNVESVKRSHVKKTSSEEEDLEEEDDVTEVEPTMSEPAVAETVEIEEPLAEHDYNVKEAAVTPVDYTPVDNSAGKSDNWKTRADELAVQAKIAEKKLAEADSSLPTSYETYTSSEPQSSGIGSAVKHLFSGWR